MRSLATMSDARRLIGEALYPIFPSLIVVLMDKKFNGIIPIIQMPFTVDGEIDEPSLRSEVGWAGQGRSRRRRDGECEAL